MGHAILRIRVGIVAARAARATSAAVAVIASLAGVAPALAQAGSGNGEPAARTTLTGAYTEEQAASGESTFRELCSSCHPTSQFTGAAFQRTWSGRPVFALFDQMRLMMPMDNPGGLTNAEYAALIAYILKLNSYPAGEQPLPAEDSALKLILFEAKPEIDG